MTRADKSRATADKRLRQKSLFDYAGNSNSAQSAASSRSPKAAMPSNSSPYRSRNASTKRKRRRDASVDSDDGAGSSSDVAAIHFEPRPAIEILDSDDDAPPKRLRKRNEVLHPLPVESQHDDSDADEVLSPKKKRLIKKSAMATLSGESGSEELEPAPKKRKLAKGKRPASPRLSNDSGDEVDEDRVPYLSYQ